MWELILSTHPMAATAPLDPYSTLQLRRDANLEQIRRAYRTLSMRWHPDKAAGKDQAAREQATERFSNIAEAFDVLTTPGAGRFSTSKALLRSAKTTRSRRTLRAFSRTSLVRETRSACCKKRPGTVPFVPLPIRLPSSCS